MKNKVVKGLTYSIVKLVLVLVISIPLIFIGCKKHDDTSKVKSFDQSVILQNDVAIMYTATLSNVDKAELKVSKDGVLISTEEISDVAPNGYDFKKTYAYSDDPKITKGHYEFDLTSGDLLKKDTISIPNYPPSFNTSVISFNCMQNCETTISIPIINDKNPEDNPVALTGIKSPDGKTQVTFKSTSTGYDLDLKDLSGSIGAFQLEFDLKDAQFIIENIILQGQITKDTRIVINPLIYIDDPNAPFNSMDRPDKDAYLQAEVNNELVIPPSSNPLYDCANYEWQLIIDSKKLKDKLRSPSSNFGKYWLYNNSISTTPDTIYKNGGTLANAGTIEAPILSVDVVDSTHSPTRYAHGMNGVLTGRDVDPATGSDLTNFKNYNIIGLQDKQTNIQSGWYSLPLNVDEVIITYPLVVEDPINGDKLIGVPLVKFRLDKGAPTLIWENKDPKYNIIKQ